MSLLSTVQPKASVIIPTRNRRASLERLLSSLQRTENLENISLEIIVVNNASTDDTEACLAAWSSKWPPLRNLTEQRPGKNFALNKAIQTAGGDIFCFMDDDIVVETNWLKALVSDFESTGYDALQPRVLPGRDPEGGQADPKILYHYNIPVIDYGSVLRELRGLTGVFMAVKRTVIEQVGMFDERLPASGYHGDTDISRRIREAGFSVGYTPHVVAYHELDPKRYGSGYARLSQYRKGLSRSLYGRDSMLGDIAPNLFANLLRYLWYRVTHNPAKIYKTEKRIMKYWGYVVGRVQRRLGREPWA